MIELLSQLAESRQQAQCLVKISTITLAQQAFAPTVG
jgi:hypothetical protein